MFDDVESWDLTIPEPLIGEYELVCTGAETKFFPARDGKAGGPAVVVTFKLDDMSSPDHGKTHVETLRLFGGGVMISVKALTTLIGGRTVGNQVVAADGTPFKGNTAAAILAPCIGARYECAIKESKAKGADGSAYRNLTIKRRVD